MYQGNSPRAKARQARRDAIKSGEYRFSDIKAQTKKISNMQYVTRGGIAGFDFQKAVKRIVKKVNRYYGNTSKYMPH